MLGLINRSLGNKKEGHKKEGIKSKGIFMSDVVDAWSPS